MELLEKGRSVHRAGRGRVGCRVGCRGAVLLRAVLLLAVPVVRVRGSRARGLLVEYRADACARVCPRGL